jgi:hypothetical protein
LRSATDCFVFCHGWLNDEAEAREGACRFFAYLDAALRPLGERVAPLRVAIHWPSKPFANGHPGRVGTRAVPDVEPLRSLRNAERPTVVARLMPPLCEAEVPLSPEEELELDALLHLVHDAESRGGMIRSSLDALSFWLTKRRAGQVGGRLGWEVPAPAFMAVGDRVPRLHLLGHSFGAKLLSSAVLGGLRPESLVLLLAAFSAYACVTRAEGRGGADRCQEQTGARRRHLRVAATPGRANQWHLRQHLDEPVTMRTRSSPTDARQSGKGRTSSPTEPTCPTCGCPVHPQPRIWEVI